MTLGQVLRRPLVRLALVLAALVSLSWAFAGQWRELRQATSAAARDIAVAWQWVLLASLVVLATHAVLVQSWRMLLAGWGGRLPYGRAVQIWTIANLGKWIPGKVWQVGALGMMAADEGVSAVAAAGAALLGTLLNIGAGFGVVALTSATALDAIRPGLRQAALLLAVLFVTGVLALPTLLPLMLERYARWRGVPAIDRHVSHTTVWIAAAINTASWAAYGIGFALFARGVTPNVSGDPIAFVAVYTASYLLGYLFLISPGGLAIREGALVALLVALGLAGRGDAAILALSSRVWITVLEILPGVISLLLLSPRQRAALRRPG